jgi:hypothetical protein
MVAFGSWLCENFSAETLTAGDLGEIGARGNFGEFSGFFSGSASDGDPGRPGQFQQQRKAQIGGELCPHRR